MNTEEITKTKQLFTYDEIMKVQGLKNFAREMCQRQIRCDDSLVLAGGCFASCLQNNSPKDYDFFILDNTVLGETRNPLNWAPATARKVISPQYTNPGNTSKITEIYQFETNQYIFTSHKFREDVVDSFDFEHCKISFHNDTLYLSHQSLIAAMNKILIPSKTNPPSRTRIDKFLDRGYKLASP